MNDCLAKIGKILGGIMAQFLGLISLTAGNFDSESATDGHVLTADGAGGAAWEAGGGGASFAFDGATFTPGEFVADSGNRYIAVELTLGGSSISSGGAIWVNHTFSENATLTPPLFGDPAIEQADDNYTYAVTLAYNAAYGILMSTNIVTVSGGKMEFTTQIQNFNSADAHNVYLIVMLPSGGTIVSDAISIPGYVE